MDVFSHVPGMMEAADMTEAMTRADIAVTSTEDRTTTGMEADMKEDDFVEIASKQKSLQCPFNSMRKTVRE